MRFAAIDQMIDIEETGHCSSMCGKEMLRNFWEMGKVRSTLKVGKGNSKLCPSLQLLIGA